MQEEGRKNKAELMEAFANFEHRETLEPFNWIWTLATESSQPDFEPVERALATDFAWAKKHAVIAQRSTAGSPWDTTRVHCCAAKSWPS